MKSIYIFLNEIYFFFDVFFKTLNPNYYTYDDAELEVVDLYSCSTSSDENDV